MVIITAGKTYLDIDAYASGIAYSVLLNGMGVKSAFVSTAKTNMSVPSLVKDLGFEINTTYLPTKKDDFILVDVSNPSFFDNIVINDKIIEVIDHHTGYDEYWKQQSCQSQIEFIGSAATIIFERFLANNRLDLLDKNLCKLLICAILDNTLNLKGPITTNRDIEAYKKLVEIANINEDFRKEYFESCQREINTNPIKAIENDMKFEFIDNQFPEIFGQVTIYDKQVIFERLNDIKNMFLKYNKPWILNIICLKDGTSYIFSSDKMAQIQIEKLFKSSFNDNILTLNKLMLRKEIIKLARKHYEINS